MNDTERVAELLGGKLRLSEAAEVHPSMISRWVKTGNIPAKYRTRIIRHAQTVSSQAIVEELAALIPDNVCPCCGQRIQV